MPPNPPSNSRLPRLAVWSGYGTGGCGSWVWVWVNVVGKKSIEKNDKIKIIIIIRKKVIKYLFMKRKSQTA